MYMQACLGHSIRDIQLPNQIGSLLLPFVLFLYSILLSISRLYHTQLVLINALFRPLEPHPYHKC